jgi:hypothetical protein
MAAISADMDAARLTYADDGNSWWAHGRRRRPLRAHAVVPAALGDDPRPGVGTVPAHRPAHRRRLHPRRQPDRGAREADRCRRRHLGRAVAQGLLARDAFLPLLRPHGRHLRDRCRRALRSVARRRGIAPRLVQPGSCAPSPTSR